MKKQYSTKHKYPAKQKHSAETSTNTSLSASSSAGNISIKQKHFEQLEKILLIPLKDFISLQFIHGHGESTMGDFIVEHILRSLGAADITNEKKIKYVNIIEQFLLSSVQKIDETAKIFQLCGTILYKLISTREHLKIKKDENSVIKYLVNSEALGKNLFNPNRLTNDELTLLDLVESLHGQLNINSDIKKNKELIQFLKDKGAKSSLEITQNPNKADYDKNVEKFKKKLEEDSSTSMRKSEGYLCIAKKVSVLAEDLGTSAELLDCLDAILNYKTDDIPRCMRLFSPKTNDECYELHVVNAFLRECYKDTDIDNYIKIIRSIVKDIPSDFLKRVYYEELGEELIKRYNKNGILTKTDEDSLDNYTREIVALHTNDNSSLIIDNSMKHHAYSLRLNYCKHKNDLKETIEVSLELMKYANSTQIEEDLYGLLIALYNMKSGSFKNRTLDYLVKEFKLSGEALEIFIELFSYHPSEQFVKKIQENLKIIDQAFSEQSPRIHTTITKFLNAFIMQTGKCSVNAMQEIINDPNFESTTSESSLRILGCLKNWSKNEIEQVNYQKVLDKLRNNDHLEKYPITNIKVAELYLAIENLDQTKNHLDTATKLLKPYKFKQFEYEIEPEVYLYEVKLGLMLKAFADKNKDFLKVNWGYIKETYNACNAIKGKFFSYYKNILDICQYYLLSRDTTIDPKLGEKLKNIIRNITEDDEVTFALEIINQTISEEQRIKEQHISEEQQVVIPASEHIEASNYASKEYSSEEKSETKANNTATTQEDSLYKESFVTKCLNHWTIIHKYYQNLKKSTQPFHDKISDLHQENYQIWYIPDKVSYTTKNKDIVSISKKHHNIYAMIAPNLLDSLEDSTRTAFINALTKGIVKNYTNSGIKILEKYFPELKINEDTRLWASKIYENNNGAVLIEFDHKTNHAGIRKAFKSNAINVIKVSGADYHTQEEDSTLNVPQESYPNIEDYPSPYDEVSCIGEES
ncbi:MAG TPA: hypothetical protein LFW12_02020 [Rickettsia endosymbiont of Sericostoma sp. HW-2014]|nr:hypothetical protein [Rickettsia endosymbiont of Sericostoma sp. HW-2014]